MHRPTLVEVAFHRAEVEDSVIENAMAAVESIPDPEARIVVMHGLTKRLSERIKTELEEHPEIIEGLHATEEFKSAQAADSRYWQDADMAGNSLTQ